MDRGESDPDRGYKFLYISDEATYFFLGLEGIPALVKVMNRLI